MERCVCGVCVCKGKVREMNGEETFILFFKRKWRGLPRAAHTRAAGVRSAWKADESRKKRAMK